MHEATTVTTEDRTVAGRHGDLQVRDYRPAVENPMTAALMWVHGGGFGSGSLDVPESHAVATALATRGRLVTTVDYRLVPAFPLLGRFRMTPSTHRYPVPVDDVCDGFLDLAARHADRTIVLGGASAGACLAASAAIRLRAAGTAVPAGLVLTYGTFHAQLPPPTPALRARMRGLTDRVRIAIGPEMTRRMNLNYAGSEELFADPATFPGTADVAGLPRTLLLDADRDVLRASGEAFAEHLMAAGVPVNRSTVAGTTHGFLGREHGAGFHESISSISTWLDT